MTKLPEALRKKLESTCGVGVFYSGSNFMYGAQECYELLAPLIKDARECAEFYGNKKNWGCYGFDHTSGENCVIRADVESNEITGGKRAREALEKIRKDGYV